MQKTTALRFNFIEQLVWWEGQINTSHLSQKFNLTRQSASAVLKQYREQYPENLTYLKSKKTFVPTKQFSAQNDLRDFSHYLQATATSNNICAEVPQAIEVEAPLRNINAKQVRPILKAIREQLAIDIGYISLSNPDYLDRIIEPHTLIFDGLRWHVRAYCCKNKAFRDFTLSRFNGDAVIEHKAEHTIFQDEKWQKFIDVIIEPDPRLTAKQQEIIANDFQMDNRQKTIRVRAALANYLILRLRLDHYKNTPEEQQIILTPECQKKISQYLPK